MHCLLLLFRKISTTICSISLSCLKLYSSRTTSSNISSSLEPRTKLSLNESPISETQQNNNKDICNQSGFWNGSFDVLFSFSFVAQLKIVNHFVWIALWPTFNRKHTLHAFGIQFRVRMRRSLWSYLRWNNTTNPIQIINLCLPLHSESYVCFTSSKWSKLYIANNNV